jgi:hypothetical protein
MEFVSFMSLPDAPASVDLDAPKVAIVGAKIVLSKEQQGLPPIVAEYCAAAPTSHRNSRA